MANGRPLDPTGKALSSKSSPTRADSSARAHESAYSTNKRTVANGFDGFSICNFPRSAQKRKKEGKKQEKAEGTFPPFIPASDLTNEAIARLKRREPSLSHFDVSSALKLRMIKKRSQEINRSQTIKRECGYLCIRAFQGNCGDTR